MIVQTLPMSIEGEQWTMEAYNSKYVFSYGEKHCPPPNYGALGHRTNYIVKQSNTFAFVQACFVLLEEKLWAEAEAAFTNNQEHWHWKI